MRSSPARRWWVPGLLALVAVTLPAVASAQPQGRARLELVEAVAGQKVVLRYTIQNAGDADLLVLSWETPLHGFYGNILDVRVDGKTAPYIGRLYKLGTPVAESYLRVAAGDSTSVDFDLGEQYLLDQGGRYTVAWRGEWGLDESKRLADSVPAPATLRFDFGGMGDGAAQKYLRSIEPRSLGRDIHRDLITRGCSGGKLDGATKGFAQARTYANDAFSYLSKENDLHAFPRYDRWFGAYTSGRHSTVQSHFKKIRDSMNASAKAIDYTVICDCDEPGVFAYVFPDLPYQVHLCPEYHNAPLKGTDSKGGTLIHESSHFTVNGGTHDHVEGQSGAVNLARSNPTQAIDNADNHEYFAENKPFVCKGNDCSGGSRLVWTVKDGCPDGKGLRVAFDYGVGDYRPVTISSGKALTFTFSGLGGFDVCIGATTDPPSPHYWCEGITLDHPAGGACCRKVPYNGTLNYTLTLTCKPPGD